VRAYEVRRDGYLVSTERSRLDLDAVHAFLSNESYWATGISREQLQRAIASSLPFGVYCRDQQLGFARAITAYATFAYLADVFVFESHRRRGVSKLLLEAVVAHPQLQELRRWLLGTRDAHGLYAQFGFIPLEEPARWMELPYPNTYTMGAAAHARRPAASHLPDGLLRHG
jgi:GNAT superfamily N-acetyltransferase